jgi:ankyrin repeat protein
VTLVGVLWNSRSDGLLTCPEFGGTTELQAAVLRNNTSLVESLSKRPDPLNPDRNFRGQSVLHLAILNPVMVTHLLNYFPDIDVDAQDDSGTTPLMYAMAYGATESSRLLLDAGADSLSSDKLNGFCAWAYALVCADDKCLAASIEALAARKPEDSKRAVVRCLWVRLLVSSARSNDLECKMLAYLTQFRIGHDLVSPGGNTVLHLCAPWEAEVLLRNGTTPINQKNSHGYTPLMVVARFRTPPLIRTIVERGAVVDDVDEHGWNALHHLNSSLIAGWYSAVELGSWQSAMESAAVLLSSGIGVNKGDDCVCLCSLSGCTPLALLLSSGDWHQPQIRNLEAIPWLLEWLILMQHERAAEAHAVLMTLYRRQRFDELGMTHTCCRRRQSSSSYLGYVDQFKRPIDDERYCKEDESNTDFEGGEIDNLSEQAIDAEEIRDEEKFFAEKLRRNCDDFSVIASADMEVSWISLLSRRAVMMEEALLKTKIKRDKQTASIRTARVNRTKVSSFL